MARYQMASGAMIGRKMIKRFHSLGILFLCCAADYSTSPINTFAGRYDRSFVFRGNGSVDRQSDIIEIVPVSHDAAYFTANFIQHDEENCGIFGVAHLEHGRLVYRDSTAPLSGEQACIFTIKRVGRSLVGSDEGGCSRQYCGAGGLGGSFALSSKRPITYMRRIKGSPEYKTAISEWRGY